MKNNFFRTLCAAFLLVPMLWSCQREGLVDESMQRPDIQGLTLDTVDCDGPHILPLAEADGNTVINYCGNSPCGSNQSPWGSVTYSKVSGGYPNSTLNIQVQMGSAWVITGYSVIVASTGAVVTSGNVPVVGNDWATQQLAPFQTNLLIELPLGSNDFGASCLEWSVVLNVGKLSLFGALIPASERTLYAYDVAGADSPFVIDRCFSACAGDASSQSKGNCNGCRSRVTTTFYGCSEVEVSACKSIRRVVVVYDDCSRQIFANLNVLSFQVPSNGKSISHVFVRSGCKNNDDDNGNDNGNNGSNNASNYRRFRFNAPCFNGGC